MTGKNYYVTEYPDGEKTFYDNDDIDILLTSAAKQICFSDYTDDRISKIVVDGQEVVYSGWQPGMVFSFENKETGEVIWEDQFSGWDH